MSIGKDVYVFIDCEEWKKKSCMFGGIYDLI